MEYWNYSVGFWFILLSLQHCASQSIKMRLFFNQVFRGRARRKLSTTWKKKEHKSLIRNDAECISKISALRSCIFSQENLKISSTEILDYALSLCVTDNWSQIIFHTNKPHVNETKWKTPFFLELIKQGFSFWKRH